MSGRERLVFSVVRSWRLVLARGLSFSVRNEMEGTKVGVHLPTARDRSIEGDREARFLVAITEL